MPKWTWEQQKEYAKRYGQLVAKAWQDAAFKQRLLADPVGVLREHGIDLPSGMEVKAVEETDTMRYMILPAKPPEEISDEALSAVAGGLAGGPYVCVGPCVFSSTGGRAS
jgi:hypothetical protein